METKLEPSAGGELAPAGGTGRGGCGGKFLIIAYGYPGGKGTTGRAGCSPHAHPKPPPVLCVGTGGTVGKTAMLNGRLRRRFTAFDLSTVPPTLVRRDYSLADLRKLGGKLPPIYFDELGNMRGGDDRLIMAGPAGAPGTFPHPETGAPMHP